MPTRWYWPVTTSLCVAGTQGRLECAQLGGGHVVHCPVQLDLPVFQENLNISFLLCSLLILKGWLKCFLQRHTGDCGPQFVTSVWAAGSH